MTEEVEDKPNFLHNWTVEPSILVNGVKHKNAITLNRVKEYIIWTENSIIWARSRLEEDENKWSFRIDRLKTQLIRLQTAEWNLSRLERKGVRGLAATEKWYPSMKTLFFVDWSLNITAKREMLSKTIARATEIIPSGVNLGEILKLNGDIITNIPTKNLEDNIQVNHIMTKIIFAILAENKKLLKELVINNFNVFEKYYPIMKPNIVELISLQYSRGGFNMYNLWDIIKYLTAFERGSRSPEEFHLYNIIELMDRGWMRDFMAIFAVIDRYYVLAIGPLTTRLSHSFDDNTNFIKQENVKYSLIMSLNKRIRTTENFYFTKRCRNCFIWRTSFACICSSTYYCSTECQNIDWKAGHINECGNLQNNN